MSDARVVERHAYVFPLRVLPMNFFLFRPSESDEKTKLSTLGNVTITVNYNDEEAIFSPPNLVRQIRARTSAGSVFRCLLSLYFRTLGRFPFIHSTLTTFALLSGCEN